GIGEPAVTAARRVGPSGRVVALDQSPGMLAMARERARELGLGNVDFREGDLEAFAVGERSFDAALCRWGLMFVPDLDAAVRAVRRTLKPGARFATAVWAAPERVAMIALGADAMRRLAGLPPRQPASLDPFMQFRYDVSAPLRATLSRCTPEVRAQIERATAEAAAAYCRADGSLSLPNEAICVGARA